MSSSQAFPPSKGQLPDDVSAPESLGSSDYQVDGVTTLEDDDTQMCDDHETKWLRTYYGSGRSITVKFGSDDNVYSFPAEHLTSKFKYFESALQSNESGPFFVEGKTRLIHVRDISSQAFSRLFKWLQTQPRLLDDCDKIVHLLQAIMVADYLGLKDPYFGDFEHYVTQRLGLALVQDRRRLMPSHLSLVRTHPAFKSKVIWSIFVDAGVRPFLQEFMLVIPKIERTFSAALYCHMTPQPGNADIGEWMSILEYCSQMREDDDEYALAVMKASGMTLNYGRWSLDGGDRTRGYSDGPIQYGDPLVEGIPTDEFESYMGMEVCEHFLWFLL